ncbi:hypothetical protein L960_1p089c (plasmid) [Escherichia coli B7A]|nr:hypothetical protein L960_1p089c [Escherichia coli B7A]
MENGVFSFSSSWLALRGYVFRRQMNLFRRGLILPSVQ